MNAYKTTPDRSSTITQLGSVRMHPEARRSAEASLRQADLIIDALMAAYADLHRAFALIGYSLHMLARRGKAAAAAPAPH